MKNVPGYRRMPGPDMRTRAMSPAAIADLITFFMRAPGSQECQDDFLKIAVDPEDTPPAVVRARERPQCRTCNEARPLFVITAG
jgi:hypothetical protein